MTYYITYKNNKLTTYERPDGSWAVRCKTNSLLVSMGDTLLLTDKAGNAKAMIKVRAFVPHVRYGSFTRSGHVVPSWVEWV